MEHIDDGKVFYGTDGVTHYQCQWLPNRERKRTYKVEGTYGAVNVLNRSCGGALWWDIRVHLCAKNPCETDHEHIKHGWHHQKPIHLQPSDWRPPAAHVSPAAVVAGEAGSAGVENGGEGEEIAFAWAACTGGDL